MSNVDCEGQGSKQEAAMTQTKEGGGLDELDVLTFLIYFDDRTKSIGGWIEYGCERKQGVKDGSEGVLTGWWSCLYLRWA